MKWFSRKVQKGTQTGQKIGYPTLNFRVGSFSQACNDGVYSCEVKMGDQIYQGALYLGPRLSKSTKVLEVHIPKFNKNIYGKFIKFRLLKKIRGAKTFSNLDDLKKQIQKDLLNIFIY